MQTDFGVSKHDRLCKAKGDAMTNLARSAAMAATLAVCLVMAPSAFADPPPHAQNGHGPNWREEGRHDNGLHRGWDRHRFNGYTYEGAWHFGPPPASLGDAVEMGYRLWRRGDVLPDYYKDSLGAVDYRLYDLSPPPSGAHYVRDDRGNYLLVGIATGLILGVILANN